MQVLATPGRAALAGLAISVLMLVVWLAAAGGDAHGIAGFVLRWLHVLGAILWVGMIWFVNFIQLAAVAEADDAGRATLMRLVVPKVAKTFRGAAHLTLVTGIGLLLTSGYMFDRVVFASAVHIADPRAILLWLGVVGGLAMWAIVSFVLKPALAVVLAPTGVTAGAKAAARERVRIFARINLVLALPVTFAMVAAAHLY